MSSPVLQTVPLGFQWPTIDPFLFCVHHLDDYPAGNGRSRPGRRRSTAATIGNDFAGVDGWRMYHGTHGARASPQHPHRGFETVTFVRQGFIDHSDSLGADRPLRPRRRAVAHRRRRASCTARCSRCSTATGPNPLELFQIWLNLPAADKMVEPYFTMLWDEDIPRHVVTDDAGSHRRDHRDRRRRSTGRAARRRRRTRGRRAPRPTSRSGTLVLEPGASWTMPTAADRRHASARSTSSKATRPRRRRPRDRRARRPARSSTRDSAVDVVAGDDGAEVLVLQGRPIGEPVAQYGPFVMNTRRRDRAGVRRLPAHRVRRLAVGPTTTRCTAPTGGRFARHADGRVEEAVAV